MLYEYVVNSIILVSYNFLKQTFYMPLVTILLEVKNEEGIAHLFHRFVTDAGVIR